MRSTKKTELERFVEFNMKVAEIRNQTDGRKPVESFISALIKNLPLKTRPKSKRKS